MSAEDRWAQRIEWEQERGELEISYEKELKDKDWQCEMRRCSRPATKEIAVALTGESFSTHVFCFCDEHSDEDCAYACYNDIYQG